MKRFPRPIRIFALTPLVTALLVCVAVVPRVHAKKTTVRVSWDEAKSMHESGDFRSGVRIILKSSERVNGKLAGITASGLRLRRQASETLIARDEIHAIRFVSRKMAGWRNRTIALAGGVPAGLFAGLGVAAGVSNVCCDFGKLGPTELIMYGTWAGIQFVLYKIGARADRETLLVVLHETGTETSESDQRPKNSLLPSDRTSAGVAESPVQHTHRDLTRAAR